uniref:BTB domain-containing protein n=1 Tax=Oryza punctata TaxID=4537 RepID=A0A0E0M7U6_ORYPU
MEEEVFEAMLTFIYTDSLPKMKRRDEAAMAQHLLVAADRHKLERLKLICEDKRNCHTLKEACLEFLRVLMAIGERYSYNGEERASLHRFG